MADKENKGARKSMTLSIPQSVARLLRMFGAVIVLLYFPVALFFVQKEKAQTRCGSIRTNVHTNGDDVLITDRGLRGLVNSEFPNLTGSLLSEVNYAELEEQIERLDVVERCEAYPTLGGAIHIDIYQRKPVMRVFSSGGSYYMDRDGFKITAINGMRTHTLVVNGNVNQMADPQPLIDLCNYINTNSFWKSMIEQVYVDRKLEFVLVPRIGNHIVEFGSTANMERKFDTLYKLYKYGWEKQEWNIYKKVSLKYEGQVVCTKR